MLAIYTYDIILSNNLIWCEKFRVVPDTDLAGYLAAGMPAAGMPAAGMPAAGMPANNFAGYQISG